MRRTGGKKKGGEKKSQMHSVGGLVKTVNCSNTTKKGTWGGKKPTNWDGGGKRGGVNNANNSGYIDPEGGESVSGGGGRQIRRGRPRKEGTLCPGD